MFLRIGEIIALNMLSWLELLKTVSVVCSRLFILLYQCCTVIQTPVVLFESVWWHEVQGGSNMTGTDFFFCNHNCSSLLQLPDRTEQVLTRAGGRVEVVASLSQGRTAAAQCGLFTNKSVPVIFEPPCTSSVCSILFSPFISRFVTPNICLRKSISNGITCGRMSHLLR